MTAKKTNKKPGDLFILQSYGSELLHLFQDAITKPEPALYLYKHKARTPLFMMESLLRLLENIRHDETIKKDRKIVKKLEDALGKVDTYDQFHQHFSKQKGVSKKQLVYFEEKMDKALRKLDARLLKHEYYQGVFNTLVSDLKINFNDEKLISRIKEELKWELKASLHFFMQYPAGFKNVETDVHELRRKLRWISIYGQSLQGILVMKGDKKKYTWEKKMINPKIKTSAYNKLPEGKNLLASIVVNQKAFIALNYVIDRLGEIKDKGLTIKALQKSIESENSAGKKKASTHATRELKLDYTEKDLLKEAYELLQRFFVEYKIHELIFG